MIEESVVDEKTRLLEEALRDAPEGATIRFGIDLFAAMMRRGSVADYASAPHDAAPQDKKVTTYRDLYIAEMDSTLPDDAFAVDV